MGFNKIPEAIADIKKGKLILVVDDKSRENEGDIVFAASKSTPAKINFLAKYARGLICVAMSAERVDALKLAPMVENNSSVHETAFTVSVEAKTGTTTGISASDRSLTAKLLADEKSGPQDFVSPGHVFPLKAKRGGVLVRAGHTEAAVDLVAMAGLGSAGVICEVMNENGTMARLRDNMLFAKKHGLKIISVEDLISYRRLQEKLIKPLCSPLMPTKHGNFQSFVYEDLIHGRRHIALVRGAIRADKPVLVRVHSECVMGDVFASQRCDCGMLLQQGMEAVARQGGVLLYMRQLDPEANFLQKMEGYVEEDKRTKANAKLGENTSKQHHPSLMDSRTYGIGAQILFDLGVRQLHLLTNNPKRIQGLEGYGLKIINQIPLGREVKSRKKVT